MADITMCNGYDCPMKDDCYRHLAKANPYRQSYFTEAPYDKETDDCKYFWSVEPEQQ